jgi:Domain of unknown function (DUF4383)
MQRALAVGVALVLVLAGMLGFAAAAHGKLFGLFRVTGYLNAGHLAGGVVGLALARTASGASAFLRVGGIMSLLFWLVGVAGSGSWLAITAADNWLHFVLGLVMLGLDYAAASASERAAVA